MTPARPAPGPPRHGLQDLAELRQRLEQLRSSLRPPEATTTYVAYTDGACLRNPDGPGGWAAVIAPAAEPAQVWELWGHLTSTSNNRAEVLGVLAAVEWVPPGSTLLLRSDSEYTVKVLAGRYRARANTDIWDELRRLIAEKRPTVRPEWVRGHAGDAGNEGADLLAVLGAVNGDAARAAQLRAAGRQGQVGAPATRPARTLPAELDGVEPRSPWEVRFVQSVAKQLRGGRPLSEKQRAVLERMDRGQRPVVSGQWSVVAGQRSVVGGSAGISRGQ